MRERCLQWESLSKMVVIYICMYALLSAGGIKRQIQLSQMMKIKVERTNTMYWVTLVQKSRCVEELLDFSNGMQKHEDFSVQFKMT